MKYEVIARRYRPRRFEEVVGQESVAQTLRGGIVQDRLAHAYLFAGPRGVGKTSMARIFAKAINCPVAADRSRPEEEWGRPCDECDVCTAVHAGQDIDVIEMDGASNRGIEDVRSLIEGVNRPGSRGAYKVYLIDEVHMLTREAFNALLKTLEEPPSHVKFIFATTEAHKIPDTVLSRCQRFDFQPIDEDAIIRRLTQITEGEGRVGTEDIFRKIARYSKGGLRDSQTLLDQLITFCEGGLTEEALDRLTGRVAASELGGLVDALGRRDSASVLTAIRACYTQGADPSVLLEQVIELLHDRLRDRLLEAEGFGAGGGEEQQPTIDVLIGSLQILLETASSLRASAYPDVTVELALIKLSRLEDPRALDRALERLVEAGGRRSSSGLSSQAGQGPQAGPGPQGGPPSGGGGSDRGGAPVLGALGAPNPPSGGRVGPPGGPPTGPQAFVEETVTTQASPPARSAASPSAPSESGNGSTAVAEAPPAEAAAPVASDPSATQYTNPCERQQLDALWEQITIEIRRRHPPVASFLAAGALLPQSPDRPAGQLSFALADEFMLSQLKAPHRKALFENLVREVTGAPWKIEVELNKELGLPTNLGPSAGPPAQVPSNLPTSQDEPAQPVVSEAEAAAAPPIRNLGAEAQVPATSVGSAPAAPPAPNRAEALAEASNAPDGPTGPSAGPPAAVPVGGRAALADHPLVKKTLELFNGRLL